MKYSKDILLVLRIPPPFGGGEIIGLLLRDYFVSKCSLLEFKRPRASKKTQGRVSLGNLWFGVEYISTTILRLIITRPQVVYLDLPKNFVAFLRTSFILSACILLRVRVIGDLAGAHFEFLSSNPFCNRLGLFFLKRVYKIRVLSRSIERNLTTYELGNLVSISNGIPDPSTTWQESKELSNSVNFLYVGKISASKGIGTILEFIDAYIQEDVVFHVHIVGEWENRQTQLWVEEIIRSHDLSRYVTFHGILVGEEKWEVFRKCHMLIHPTNFDGQPVTMLESLAMGLPVIATKVGAIPDTVDDGVTGYLMRENTAEEIIQGVRMIMGDPETYRRFSGEARRAYHEKYRVDLFLSKMENLLRGSIPSPPSKMV